MTDATTPEQPRTAATTATIAFGALLHRLEEVWIRAGDPEVRAITDGLYAWFEKVEAQARPAVAPLALNPEAEEALDRILGPAVASEGLRAALMRARALLIVGAVAHPNYAEWEKWLQEVDHFLDQTEAQARPAVASEGLLRELPWKWRYFYDDYERGTVFIATAERADAIIADDLPYEKGRALVDAHNAALSTRAALAAYAERQGES